MIKKYFFMIIALGLVGLYAEELNLDDKTLVENFGASLVKKKLDLYDPDEIGLWVLKNEYQSKYQKTRNDEFEFNDAKEWALNNFKKKLEMTKPIDVHQEYHLLLSIDFGEYDFKTKRFAVKAIEKGTYMSYSGKGELVSNYSNSKLEFDNAVDQYNFIEMEKDEAKEFIRSRKDKYGTIDRRLSAHYIYTITDFQEVNEFKPNESQMTIKFTGHLKLAEFMDKEGKKILKTINFDQNQSHNENNTTQPLNETSGDTK